MSNIDFFTPDAGDGKTYTGMQDSPRQSASTLRLPPNPYQQQKQLSSQTTKPVLVQQQQPQQQQQRTPIPPEGDTKANDVVGRKFDAFLPYPQQQTYASAPAPSPALERVRDTLAMEKQKALDDKQKKEVADEKRRELLEKHTPGEKEIKLYLLVEQIAGGTDVPIEKLWVEPGSQSLHSVMLKGLGDVESNFEQAWVRHVTAMANRLISGSIEWIRRNCELWKNASLYSVISDSAHLDIFLRVCELQYAEKETSAKGRWTRLRESNDRIVNYKRVHEYFSTRAP